MEIVKTERGYLTILTGKTDMGKSTITVYDCAENLKNGESVLFFSFEYCQSIIFNKLISHFGLKWQQLFNINVVDSKYLSLDNIIGVARHKKGHVDSIYVDYLDLVKQNSFEGSDLTDLEQIQLVVNKLASLAKELDVKIVLLTQTGSELKLEDTVEQLNNFTSGVKDQNVIKMMIDKGALMASSISQDNISHIILVDGYNMSYYSTVNFKEIYKN